MKSEKEILERIERIKTLSNGYGINERRIKELEWVLKPSKITKSDDGHLLSVSYLMEQHKELDSSQAESLLQFCARNTITFKSCYGDGRIMYPKWKEEFKKSPN